jgi:hypothetical protein
VWVKALQPVRHVPDIRENVPTGMNPITSNLKKEYIMKEKAIEVLHQCVQDRTGFCPVVGVIKEKKIDLILTPWENDKEKIKALRNIGMDMGNKGLSECLIITDAYLRIAQSPEEGKYIKDNWDTEQPSLYPEKFRQDALVFSVINFKDISQEKMEYIKYSKNNSKVTILKNKKPETLQVCGGEIKNSIAEGFLRGIFNRMAITTTRPFDSIREYIASEYPGLDAYLKG